MIALSTSLWICKLGWRWNKPESSEGPTAIFAQMLCVGDSCGNQEQEVDVMLGQVNVKQRESRAPGRKSLWG